MQKVASGRGPELYLGGFWRPKIKQKVKKCYRERIQKNDFVYKADKKSLPPPLGYRGGGRVRPFGFLVRAKACQGYG